MTGEQPINQILTCEEPINRFDKIYLINQYGTESYLARKGYSTCSGKFAIETNKKASGDSLWEIRSANEPNVGGPIKYEDKIQLINIAGTKSYLDTCGGSKGIYGVQTSTSPNRDSGSGTWEIKAVGDIMAWKRGGLIKSGDKIHLKNRYGRMSYLDTFGGFDGEYGLQTSPNPDRDSGSGTWKIVSEGCFDMMNGDITCALKYRATRPDSA